MHLEDIPQTPASWRDDKLAADVAAVRRVRRVVTMALEVQRQGKVIGSSLEAAPVLHVEDAQVREILKQINMDDLFITSGVRLSGDPAPAEAFRLPEVAGVAVVFERADGEKCERCWKILPDVGRHKHPGTCARCNEALG